MYRAIDPTARAADEWAPAQVAGATMELVHLPPETLKSVPAT